MNLNGNWINEDYHGQCDGLGFRFFKSYDYTWYVVYLFREEPKGAAKSKKGGMISAESPR